jgi:WD40 repeat protein
MLADESVSQLAGARPQQYVLVVQITMAVIFGGGWKNVSAGPLPSDLTVERVRPEAEKRITVVIHKRFADLGYQRLQTPAPVDGIAFTPDDRCLSIMCFEVTELLWDLPAQEVSRTDYYRVRGRRWDYNESRWITVRRLHPGFASTWQDVGFFPNGNVCAVAGSSWVYVWDRASTWHGQKSERIGEQGYVRAVAFSPDGKTFAAGFTGSRWRSSDAPKVVPSTILTVEVAELLRRSDDGSKGKDAAAKAGPDLTRDRGPIRDGFDVLSIAFSRDSKRLAAAGRVAFQATYDARLALRPNPPKDPAPFDPKREPLGIACVWNAETGELLREVRVPFDEDHHLRTRFSYFGILAVRFLADANSIVTCDQNGRICFWDLASGHKTRELARPGISLAVLELSPDGRILASGGEVGSLILWDVASGKEITSLTGSQADIWCLAFSHNGEFLAAGDRDGVVHLWRLPKDALANTPPP